MAIVSNTNARNHLAEYFISTLMGGFHNDQEEHSPVSPSTGPGTRDFKDGSLQDSEGTEIPPSAPPHYPT